MFQKILCAWTLRRAQREEGKERKEGKREGREGGEKRREGGKGKSINWVVDVEAWCTYESTEK